jgi:septation ring formation regulator EzrA
MDLNIIVSLAGLIVLAGGGFMGFGILKNRVDNLEKSLAKEEEKNSDQHKEFYSVKDSTLVMETEMKGIGERLKEIEMNIKEILARLTAKNVGGL